MEYSDDQAVAFDAVAEALLSAGIDLKNDSLLPQSDNKNKILAILGKAGSGKTLLLDNGRLTTNKLKNETINY